MSKGVKFVDALNEYSKAVVLPPTMKTVSNIIGVARFGLNRAQNVAKKDGSYTAALRNKESLASSLKGAVNSKDASELLMNGLMMGPMLLPGVQANPLAMMPVADKLAKTGMDLVKGKITKYVSSEDAKKGKKSKGKRKSRRSRKRNSRKQKGKKKKRKEAQLHN